MRAFLTFSTLLSSFFWTAVLFGTTFYERPFPETVQDAPVIARGKVGMTYSNWAQGQDGVRRIYTFYELQVDEVFKGQLTSRSGKPLQTAMMRTLGGEKAGVGMSVPGAPKFSRGEDVVVMLGPVQSDDSREILGLMMGKYNVERDSDGREFLTGPGLNPENRVGMQSPDQHRHDHDERAEHSGPKWTLERLRDLISEQSRQSDDSAAPTSVEAAQPSANSAKNPSLSPPSGATPSSERATAPALQPQEDGGAHDESSELVLIFRRHSIPAALVLAALVLVIWAVRRKRE